MKKVYIETNGCDIVGHDTQRYSQYFRNNGYQEVHSINEADLILFTTCALTKEFEDSSIFSLEEIKSEINKNQKIIIGGCLPKINPKRLEIIFNGFSFGKNDENKLDELINAKIKISDIFWDDDIIRDHFKKRDKSCREKPYFDDKDLELKFFKNLSEKMKDDRYLKIFKHLTPRREFLNKPEYFQIKIADGCNYKCSYCAVKNAKGNLKSRDLKEIIKEFKIGIQKGYSKILITGDEVGEYGRDIKSSLIELLKKIIPLSKDSQIALRYIHPESIINQYKYLEPYFKSKKICYFCSSFQSGSSKILKLMNRPDNINVFTQLMEEISEKYPDVYKHSHIIVGFPQETEKDFNLTLEVIKKIRFDYLDILPYSKRPGTKADKMAGHLSKKIINSRYKKAINVISKIRRERFKKMIIKISKEGNIHN